MTTTAKQSAVLDSMVSQVLNRKKPGGQPSTPSEKPQEPGKPASGPLTPQQAEYFGSVAQARATVAQAVSDLRGLAAALVDLAGSLEYGHDLVLPAPADGTAALPDPAAVKKAKEAEADARHRAPADEQAIVAIMAEALPILAMADGKWYCPDHNQREVRASKKTGREYVGCPVPGCTNLERGL